MIMDNKRVGLFLKTTAIISVLLSWCMYEVHDGILPCYCNATESNRACYYLKSDGLFLRHDLFNQSYKRSFHTSWNWIMTKHKLGDSLNIKYNPEDPSCFYPSDDAYALERFLWREFTSLLFFSFVGFIAIGIINQYPWHLRKRFKDWFNNL